MQSTESPPLQTEFTSEMRAQLTAVNSLNSPLLRLPAELRNKIYEFCFQDVVGYIDMLMPRSPNKSLSAHHVRGPITLLLACRQMHFEASALLYSVSTFVMGLYWSDAMEFHRRKWKQMFKGVLALEVEQETADRIIRRSRWVVEHFAQVFPALKSLHVRPSEGESCCPAVYEAKICKAFGFEIGKVQVTAGLPSLVDWDEERRFRSI